MGEQGHCKLLGTPPLNFPGHSCGPFATLFHFDYLFMFVSRCGFWILYFRFWEGAKSSSIAQFAKHLTPYGAKAEFRS